MIGCLPAGAAGVGVVDIWTAAVGDGPLPAVDGAAAGVGVEFNWTAAVGDGPLPADEGGVGGIYAYLTPTGPAGPAGRPGGLDGGPLAAAGVAISVGGA